MRLRTARARSCAASGFSAGTRMTLGDAGVAGTSQRVPGVRRRVFVHLAEESSHSCASFSLAFLVQAERRTATGDDARRSRTRASAGPSVARRARRRRSCRFSASSIISTGPFRPSSSSRSVSHRSRRPYAAGSVVSPSSRRDQVPTEQHSSTRRGFFRRFAARQPTARSRRPRRRASRAVPEFRPWWRSISRAAGTEGQ